MKDNNRYLHIEESKALARLPFKLRPVDGCTRARDGHPEVLRLSDLIIDGSNEQEQVSSRTGDEDHGVEGGD